MVTLHFGLADEVEIGYKSKDAGAGELWKATGSEGPGLDD
jgi:hypothetical protein